MKQQIDTFLRILGTRNVIITVTILIPSVNNNINNAGGPKINNVLVFALSYLQSLRCIGRDIIKCVGCARQLNIHTAGDDRAALVSLDRTHFIHFRLGRMTLYKIDFI